ncbi:uncharacterized protein LOC127791669 [Diospyros lotus]|uniref:uncharacterized protein LOC127791669 n=1 Tax=Diospyros lotus TaxID=55363 RepID=UPI0022565A74|nr:uncharacterized protein LOC127791669 [Diospyros lotus]
MESQPFEPERERREKEETESKIKMERHIQNLLNRLSCASVAIATITLLVLFLQTPETCLPLPHHPSSAGKAHLRHPKSTCDFSHRSFTSLEKKNHRIWSTNGWRNKVHSFTSFFSDLQSRHRLFHNHSKVLCVAAGPGHAVMALHQIGVADVTAVEVIDSPPLVRRADPHNLPFFDGVFDLGFTAYFDLALFPERFAAEMERTVRVGGVCVVAMEECGSSEIEEVTGFFRKSRFVSAENVTLTGSKMTRIILRIISPP